jgi:hypothetical protein
MIHLAGYGSGAGSDVLRGCRKIGPDHHLSKDIFPAVLQALQVGLLT